MANLGFKSGENSLPMPTSWSLLRRKNLERIELDLFFQSDDVGNNFAPETFAFDSAKKTITRRVTVGKKTGENSFRLDSSMRKYSPPEIFDKMWLMSKTKPSPKGKNKLFRSVDLFAGCGGLSVGVQDAINSIGCNFETTFASDIDEDALKVFSENLSPKQIFNKPIEDLFELDFTAPTNRAERKLKSSCQKIDFLIGGPPCQGHSDLNNHTRRNDPRNELYGIMGRAAGILNPRFIIIENVVGVQHASTNIAQRTIEKLNKIGYKTISITLNAATFGVAQNRKRHFTIGLTGSLEKFQRTLLSLQKQKRPVMWAIDDIIDESDTYNDPFRTAATHSQTNNARINFLFDQGLYELPDSERPDCHRLKPHAYNSVYGRIRPDGQAPTITSGFGSTGQGRFVHPHKRRTITPHEAARIQFFPDWFNFTNVGRRQLQKFIGNAVPPKLGYVLGVSLLNSEEF